MEEVTHFTKYNTVQFVLTHIYTEMITPHSLYRKVKLNQWNRIRSVRKVCAGLGYDFWILLSHSTHEQTSQRKLNFLRKRIMTLSHKGIGWAITIYIRNHILDIKAHVIDVFASKGQ